MSYSVVNNVAKINGEKGFYTGSIPDESACYGRNAIKNFIQYQKKISNSMPQDSLANWAALESDVFNKKLEEALPPLDYEVRYMPTKKLDKTALFAAAYEEMGQVEEMSVKVLG